MPVKFERLSHRVIVDGNGGVKKLPSDMKDLSPIKSLAVSFLLLRSAGEMFTAKKLRAKSTREAAQIAGRGNIIGIPIARNGKRGIVFQLARIQDV
jgi:hypothetical protein